MSTSPSLPEPIMNPICLDNLEPLDSLDFLETTEPHENLKTPVRPTHPSTHECQEPSPKEPFAPLPKMTIPVTVQCGPIIFSVSALLDSGSDESLMDESLASQYCLPLVPLDTPIALFLADGQPATSPHVNFQTQLLKLQTQEHIEVMNLYVSKLAHPIILGLDWLVRHNPLVDWETQSLTFLSSYCSTHCLPEPTKNQVTKNPLVPSATNCHINQASMVTLGKLTDQVYPYIGSSDSTSGNFPTCLTKEFSNVFDKTAAQALPTHSEHDFAIDLEPGFKPPHGKVYSLTTPETVAMNEYVRDNLEKGFIRPSKSPAAAPCFFVGKKDGTLRPVQDYRGLNAGTIKNRYPIPLISELLRDLSKGKIFTTLDLRAAYNLVRIKPGDEWKTAFICKAGHYEHLVMAFGFANAPAHFQSMMQAIFHDLIGRFVLIYLDDIIIFSENPKDHLSHVQQVLARLQDNRLFCKKEKCFYGKTSLDYLGYVILPSGISMSPKKTQAIQDWPTPTNTHDVQVLLGFTNFYRRFVPSYARITQPMTALLRKDVKFEWSITAEQSLQQLKEAFCKDVILRHPDESKEFLVEVDASDYAVGGVLSQYDADKQLRPVAFFSRQMVPAERNYEIYDKELLAITTCLKEWRHFLQGSHTPFTILTDHKNLEYFMTTKQLTRRQARWSLFLAEFRFNLAYRPGSHNGKADRLSRRPDFKVDEEPQNLVQMLNPSMVVAPLDSSTAIFSPTLRRYIILSKDWPLLIADFLQTDAWLPNITDTLRENCVADLPHYQMVNDIFAVF
ncbi:hypothetical protein BASA50_010431 [Batrachochytrium salamandrivorans]|uniref:RNA-directed DNA polymerase n=1 Tax=Batrachochytrium salamandrivorans TaxID=1357716 RepID=A0ABQ8EYM8_9FUNG|nr:hypothetical protein BASA50_010431 [Batrachochytrium salamandrivorans]